MCVLTYTLRLSCLLKVAVMAVAYCPATIIAPLPSTELQMAKLRMLEARKALDDYELTQGFESPVELQSLEKEFSRSPKRT